MHLRRRLEFFREPFEEWITWQNGRDAAGYGTSFFWSLYSGSSSLSGGFDDDTDFSVCVMSRPTCMLNYPQNIVVLYGLHYEIYNINIKNDQTWKGWNYGSSRSLALPISHIIRRRRYGMSFCVNVIYSSPLDRPWRNWHVKTPQSKPFSCCGSYKGVSEATHFEKMPILLGNNLPIP